MSIGRGFTGTKNMVRNLQSAAFRQSVTCPGSLVMAYRAGHSRAGSMSSQTTRIIEEGRQSDDCKHNVTQEPEKRLWLRWFGNDDSLGLHLQRRGMLDLPRPGIYPPPILRRPASH